MKKSGIVAFGLTAGLALSACEAQPSEPAIPTMAQIDEHMAQTDANRITRELFTVPHHANIGKILCGATITIISKDLTQPVTLFNAPILSLPHPGSNEYDQRGNFIDNGWIGIAYTTGNQDVEITPRQVHLGRNYDDTMTFTVTNPKQLVCDNALMYTGFSTGESGVQVTITDPTGEGRFVGAGIPVLKQVQP